MSDALLITLALLIPLAGTTLGSAAVFFLIQDNRKVVSVEIGNTVVVKGSIDNIGEEGIEWTSSNVDVATVTADGTVYGVSPGEAEIASKIDDDVIDKYRVIVYSYEDRADDAFNPKYVAVKDVSLDITEKNLYVGDTFNLNVTISPKNATNKNIKWESSDQNIATVNQSGLVTALAPGKVEITATSINKKVSKATVNIIQKENVVPTPTPKPSQADNISSITIDQGQSKALKIGATKQLTVSFNPANSYSSITWESSNPSIASVDSNGKVTANKLGYAIIKATSRNNVSTGFIVIVKSQVVPELVYTASGNSTSIGGTIQIGAENNTGSPISFSSSNTKVANVDNNGTITTYRSGNVKITIKSDGIEKDFDISVYGNRVHFINIGVAGDATLLESNGKFAMVDVGGKDQASTIKNYLDNLGVSNLEFVILTHPHSDHIGGMIELLNSGVKVNTIYTKKYNFNDIAAVNGSTSTRTRVNNTLSAANKYNINVIYVDQSMSDGSSISLNNMKIYFYNTMQRLVTTNSGQSFNYNTSNHWAGKSENVNSIVNLVRVNNRNVLLTADLNQYSILKTIVNNVKSMLSNSGQRLDVYKVAHHGYHNCTGNKNLTIGADRYIVTNSIDNRAGDGSYQITNDTTTNGDSCFKRMNVDMCSAYYANNSTRAVVASLYSSGVYLSGGGYGRNATSRCN